MPTATPLSIVLLVEVLVLLDDLLDDDLLPQLVSVQVIRPRDLLDGVSVVSALGLQMSVRSWYLGVSVIVVPHSVLVAVSILRVSSVS